MLLLIMPGSDSAQAVVAVAPEGLVSARSVPGEGLNWTDGGARAGRLMLQQAGIVFPFGSRSSAWC